MNRTQKRIEAIRQQQARRSNDLWAIFFTARQKLDKILDPTQHKQWDKSQELIKRAGKGSR